MATFLVLRSRPARPAVSARTCPLCLDAPMLAGELICHGCRSEALALGVGRS